VPESNKKPLIHKIYDLFDADSPVAVTLTDGRVEKGKITGVDFRMMALEKDDGSVRTMALSRIEDIEPEKRKKITGNAHRNIMD
jgi:small nuclear ribonucleoprotein (snRNP)-like protein